MVMFPSLSIDCGCAEEEAAPFIQFTASGTFKAGTFNAGTFNAGTFVEVNPNGYKISGSNRGVYTSVPSVATPTVASSGDVATPATGSHSTPMSATSTLTLPSVASPVSQANDTLSVQSPTSPFRVLSLDEVQVYDSRDARLGRGASGSVTKGVHEPTGRPLALKTIPVDVSESKGKQIIIELSTLHHSQCPQIVGFYGAFFKERALTLVLEHMDAGSLKDFMTTVNENIDKWGRHTGGSTDQRVPEQVLAIIAAQMLKALHYLHTVMRTIHRDIKPSNILLSMNGAVKLADFGVSGELEAHQRQRNTFVGTLVYMSPERILAQSYPCESDIWSLGLTIMECAIGRFPYLAASTPENKNHGEKRKAPGSGLGLGLPRKSGKISEIHGPSTTGSAASGNVSVNGLGSPLSSPINPVTGLANSPLSASSFLYNATNTTVRTPPKLKRLSSTPISTGVSGPDVNGGMQIIDLPPAPLAPAKRESSFCFFKSLHAIVKEPVPTLPANANYSSEFADFLHQCLEKDSNRRPSAATLLLHPFFTKHCALQDDAKDLAVLQEWIRDEESFKATMRTQSLLRYFDDANSQAATPNLHDAHSPQNSGAGPNSFAQSSHRRMSWGQAVPATQALRFSTSHSLFGGLNVNVNAQQLQSPSPANLLTPQPLQAASIFSAPMFSGASSINSSVASTPIAHTPSSAASTSAAAMGGSWHNGSSASAGVLPPLPPPPMLVKSYTSHSHPVDLSSSNQSPASSPHTAPLTFSTGHSFNRAFRPLSIEVPRGSLVGKRRARDSEENFTLKISSLTDMLKQRDRATARLTESAANHLPADNLGAKRRRMGADTPTLLISPSTSPTSVGSEDIGMTIRGVAGSNPFRQRLNVAADRPQSPFSPQSPLPHLPLPSPTAPGNPFSHPL